MPEIDGARLLRDLRHLAEFGRYKSGVHRPTFSPQDVESRQWLVGCLREAGLAAEIDGIGNIMSTSPASGPKLLIGSHLESQSHAGWLDGAMGVIFGLEVARAFREDPTCRDLGIEVAVFADEEGHFGSFLGSRSFIGELSDEDVAKAANRATGQPLTEALAQAGFGGRPRYVLEPDRHVGFIEAHIEQGDTLESTGRRVGVVTSIVGIWTYEIVFEGQQNHAGTTRMAARKDAGFALTELCHAISKRFPEVAGERSVWTTGRIRLEPGAPSIIPGRADMYFQFRDAEPERLQAMERALEELVEASDKAGPCRASLRALSRSVPNVMALPIQAALEEAAERHAPGSALRMPSGAGHDAQYLARRLPAGMVFVPSIGGISHHWTEDTADADLVLGCQVLATAAETLLRAA
ncbi:Zn-dependent hydrolase [Marinivivus vitaminiproducens]|uniref:Zn-dependent hydrolase n=1 Tax=Marinivivus vitaminiproducens TaxID=3035935 RepID=UPI0027A0FE2F|nr:Zn-dependent hydrolase [Geminicoccaceae bacterium SCSIO 64248]